MHIYATRLGYRDRLNHVSYSQNISNALLDTSATHTSLSYTLSLHTTRCSASTPYTPSYNTPTSPTTTAKTYPSMPSTPKHNKGNKPFHERKEERMEDYVPAWSSKHHCGDCAKPGSNETTPATCLGLHSEVCKSFHQTLHYIGASTNCDRYILDLCYLLLIF